ncbi:MAG: hypothetical protein ACREN7_08005 [Candidatus Dormibacteria bacterium]
MTEEAGGLALAIDGSRRGAPLVVVASRVGRLLWRSPEVAADPALERSVGMALARYRERIELVLAVRGPGSYIGVRSGLAAALGVAQGRGCPLALIGALELVAHTAEPDGGITLALADAGRGGTYGQLLAPAPEREGSGTLRWRTRGPAQLLGRELPWPKAWQEAACIVGTAGSGRELPRMSALTPCRSRAGAVAELIRLGPTPISAYDQVAADYAEPLGVR